MWCKAGWVHRATVGNKRSRSKAAHEMQLRTGQQLANQRCLAQLRRVRGGTRLLASVLQAASARDFLNAGALEAAPRGRDLLKLAHCRTDSSPARPTKTSNWEAGRGTRPRPFGHLLCMGAGGTRRGTTVALMLATDLLGNIHQPSPYSPQTSSSSSLHRFWSSTTWA